MATTPPSWRRYLRIGGPDVAADIHDELTFHLEERVQALVAGGMRPADAQAKAHAEFGDLASTRAQLRAIDQRIHQRRTAAERLEVIGGEVRLALRRLIRQPGFSVPAVVTLGLGLAATAIAFALLQGVVLRPLPYPEADRLVALSSPMPKLDDVWGIARHQLPYYKENVEAFEDMALYRAWAVTIPGEGTVRAERVVAASVSASIFPTLRIGPSLGRVLRPEDNLERTGSVVVLSHGYWNRRFGGDPSVVGRMFTVDGTPREIVGVTPRGATLPDRQVDLWMPDYIDPAAQPQNNHVRNAVARLRAGFTAADAEAQLVPLVARMDEIFPSAYPNHWIRNSGFRTAVATLHDDVVGASVTRSLWILFAAVCLVLLVAVANVVSLVMVRAEATRRETAMRTALGASRQALATQFLTEALVVTGLAALGAVVLTVLAIGVLPAVAADVLPRLTELRLTWQVGLLLGGASLAIAGLIGMIPLVQAATDVRILREGSRSLAGSRRRTIARNVLVVGQVALTVILLAAAGLLIRSGLRLRAIDPGFEPEGVITLDLALSPVSYRSYEAAAVLYRRLAEEVAAVPGVQSVGFTEALPLAGDLGCTGVSAEAEGALGPRGRCIPLVQVSPGYFETMGIAVRGSTPTWGDMAQRVGGVVVSPALAQRLWPDQNPIGRRIQCCSGVSWDRVVGVTGAVHGNSLDTPPGEMAYFPIVQPDSALTNNVPLNMHMVVKAPTLEPVTVQRVVGEALSRIDPAVPASAARPMTALVADSMANRTLMLSLIAIAAAMALLLSAIGLYGVIAYVVGQRERELGIRVAIGASGRQIGALVMAHSVRLVGVGIVLGLAGAVLGTRVLTSFLFEVSPTDPAVLMVVVGLVAGLSLVATWVPTRRAVRIDPVIALRAD
jgi:predicted permease